MILTTTLNRIRAHSPCESGWRKLLGNLGKTQADDEVLGFKTILDSNGLEDALWCLRVEPPHSNLYRLFAVQQARKVQHLRVDLKSLGVLDIAEKHAKGQASDAELSAAWAAAWAAARASAWDTGTSAAWDAARAAARAAAWDAAWDAARAAARDAAWDAGTGAAWSTAWAAAWETSKQDFIEAFCTK